VSSAAIIISFPDLVIVTLSPFTKFNGRLLIALSNNDSPFTETGLHVLLKASPGNLYQLGVLLISSKANK
jgi:hypothetical protein